MYCWNETYWCTVARTLVAWRSCAMLSWQSCRWLYVLMDHVVPLHRWMLSRRTPTAPSTACRNMRWKLSRTVSWGTERKDLWREPLGWYGYYNTKNIVVILWEVLLAQELYVQELFIRCCIIYPVLLQCKINKLQDYIKLQVVEASYGCCINTRGTVPTIYWTATSA